MGAGRRHELEGTQATLVANVIVGNGISATIGYGGGVEIASGGPVTLVDNTMILGNTAAITGNSIGYGGVIAWAVTPTLSGNVVQGNTANAVVAGFGGGLYIPFGNIFI